MGREKTEMLSTITSVISGRTKICDIDMLLIVGTSSLFNNVMQPMHELMTLLLYHHTGQTERYIWTDGIGLKKRQLLVLRGSTRLYICAC